MALCFVSMVGSSLVQSNFARTDVTDYKVTLAELAEMIRGNNEITGRDIQTHFT